MSGSRKQFVYVTGLGDLFAIEADESNVENVLTTALDSDMTDADVQNINYFLPSNVSPRYAWFKSTTTVRKKKIIIPRLDYFNDLITGAGLFTQRGFVDPDTGETFVFSGAYPERFRPVVFSADTGLNDGDFN